MSYINNHGGTRSLPLGLLATTIWDMCLARGLRLLAQHIPGTYNVVADIESRRTFAKNAWQIIPRVFSEIESRLGPHDAADKSKDAESQGEEICFEITKHLFLQLPSLKLEILAQWEAMLL